jgi:hypothetical protein
MSPIPGKINLLDGSPLLDASGYIRLKTADDDCCCEPTPPVCPPTPCVPGCPPSYRIDVAGLSIGPVGAPIEYTISGVIPYTEPGATCQWDGPGIADPPLLADPNLILWCVERDSVERWEAWVQGWFSNPPHGNCSFGFVYAVAASACPPVGTYPFFFWGFGSQCSTIEVPSTGIVTVSIP